MTRISAVPLEVKFANNLLSQLSTIVSKVKASHTRQFLETLLTPVEQIMLAKRIAVIVMLHEGCSVYRIIRVLHMSSSTVIEMKRKYEEGFYKPITRMIGMSKTERENFWKKFEVILRAGMPSRGRDRWKWLDEVVPGGR